jgi:hypothetical protein
MGMGSEVCGHRACGRAGVIRQRLYEFAQIIRREPD